MIEYKDYGYKTSNNACTYEYLAMNVKNFLSIQRNKTIIDVGCGNGWLASYLISQGFNVYGTDASVTGIEISKQKYPDRFFIQDISTESLPKELVNIKFDTIISTEVIEHLYNPRKFIAFCKQILELNEGGELILSTPYHGYLKNLVLALSGKMDDHFTVLWDGGILNFGHSKH